MVVLCRSNAYKALVLDGKRQMLVCFSKYFMITLATTGNKEYQNYIGIFPL